ncbi:MAG: ABC transporter ATP-binding protein [Actinobacteria bacterium]|nr:ABC transporter ATP-binding protein [Actinomycetota bacterium]
MQLEIDQLTLGYGAQIVARDLSFKVSEGCITTLIGRNGSGKSTLVRAIGRLLRPQQGAILLDGKAISSLPTKQLAQHLAILPQGPSAPDGVTVRDLVEHGRYPHRTFLGLKSEEDHLAVAWALNQTDMTEVADRPLGQLSGGQRQRAWIAMALAQDTDIILLDEPTTFLDVAYQLEAMELLKRLNQRNGTTILMVLHDINQAAQYSDQLIAVNDGSIYAAGCPADVVTAEMVHDVFGLDADIITDRRTGAPICIPYALARAAVQPGEAQSAEDSTQPGGSRAEVHGDDRIEAHG